MRTPRCTYRVQLHPEFTFDHLAEIVPYLHGLGVSDCYCSPIFRPTPGSRHGYDVCDYSQINPELGGEAGLARLSSKLKAFDMGLLLDFVPNHMGIEGPYNLWWQSVLELGQGSPYADFFDIQWDDRGNDGKPQVLVPLLPDHYGILLEKGQLCLVQEDGVLALAHESTRFPLRPETYEAILERARGKVPVVTESFYRQEGELVREWYRRALSSSQSLNEAVSETLRELNGKPGDPTSFDELDELIGNQHYRLARWQAGAHGTNYRRFFAIDTLVGLRMEDPRVFEASHAYVRRLIREGTITGLRIDHIDGLRQPFEYLKRLQSLAANARENSPGDTNFYVIVEKILAAHETLPSEWPVAGTTGYEFIQKTGQLFTDPGGEAIIDKTYSDFTQRNPSFLAAASQEKRLVLKEMFANTVLALAQSLHERIQIDRRWRDFTISEFSAGIGELFASFSVYRTYRTGRGASEVDRRQIAAAADRALKANRRIEPAIVLFVRDILLGDYPEAEAVPEHHREMTEWVLTFQQYTGAVMAKSVEDTAYYTANRLIALNEVGGSPEIFGQGVEAFHEENQRQFSRSRHSLLTTSTHDTKMSEDVRARLHILSEIGSEWGAQVAEWSRLNREFKTQIGGAFAPDTGEEYRLYQTLLGAWPLDSKAVNAEFGDRIQAYFRKAISEAKVNTTALRPNSRWIEACDQFVRSLLSEDSAFRISFEPFAARIAQLGVTNSLAQLVLKLTVPGVPDIYQGNEGFDFSLVDPDNRRPVSFPVALESRQEELSFSAELTNWRTGNVKLEVTKRVLRLRQEHPQLFSDGVYIPLSVEGKHADRIVAFERQHQQQRLLVVIPRLTAGLTWPPAGDVWEETCVVSPSPVEHWQNAFAGGQITPSDRLPVRILLREIPVGVFYGTINT